MIIIGSSLVLVRGSVYLRLQRCIDEAVHRPWRRPSATTLRANQGSSSRLPRIRSFPIEVVWCGGIERIIASVLSTLSGGSLTRSVNPTPTVSRKAVS
jgi:hypothetical protein